MFAPQQLAHLDGVIEETTAVVVIEPARVVFLFLPTNTDAEFKATASEHIDCCGLFGEHGWGAQCRNQNCGVEANSLGERAHRGENSEGLKPVAIGIGGLLAANRATLLRVAIGLEVLAVGNVIAHGYAINSGHIGSSGLIKDVGERSRIVLSECAQLNRDLRCRHGLMLSRPLIERRCRTSRLVSSRNFQ